MKSKTAKPASYLIELTNDRQIIDKFREMNVTDGTTYVTSGLLRALPVIAKGNNPRKAIIVISDGIDIDGGVLTKNYLINIICATELERGCCVTLRVRLHNWRIYSLFSRSIAQKRPQLSISGAITAQETTFSRHQLRDIINVLTGIAKNPR